MRIDARCLGLLALLAFSGIRCLNSGDGELQHDRPFWARKINLTDGSSTQYQVWATERKKTEHAIVFVERGNMIDSQTIDRLVNAFESNIAPVEHSLLAYPSDIDGNGRVIFLLMDIDDGYQTGGKYIAGYFDAINQFSDLAASQMGWRSNAAEMLYLDTYPAEIHSASFLATLAHEYQHLLKFSFGQSAGFIEEQWVDEGLAEIASDLTGYGPQTARGSYFASSVITGDSLTDFTNPEPLRDYASSYVYFRYLLQIYGPQGVSKIFRSGKAGAAGLDSAIAQIDPQITTRCGNTTNLELPYFACSYRFMWAALVNTLGAMPSTVSLSYNGNTGVMTTTGSTDYNWLTGDTAWRDTMVQALQAGSRLRPGTATTIDALHPYAPALFQTNYPSGAAATFSTCSSCGLTMVSGNKYFVVFNHKLAAMSSTASVIDLNISESADKDFSALSELAKEDQTAVATHWHARLAASQIDSMMKIDAVNKHQEHIVP